MSGDWTERAACRGKNPTIFLDRNRRDEALAICRGCEVTDECLTDAIANGHDGVRGGTLEHQRPNGGEILSGRH